MNIPKTYFLIAILVLSTLSAYSQSKRVELGAEEFEKTIQSLQDEQVVDVRTPDEFAGGYIDGAFNIDINGSEFTKQVSALEKNRPTLVYCLSGGRSAKAAEYMRKNGFTNVIELKGGMMEWKSRKKPVEVKKETGSGMSSNLFAQHLATDKIVLVDFYAKWCAPCKKMAPDLQSLQEERRDHLVLVKLDVDANSFLLDSLRINALPGLLLFKNGNIVWRHTGYADKQMIESQLIRHLPVKK
jgi:thioredoxin 1